MLWHKMWETDTEGSEALYQLGVEHPSVLVILHCRSDLFLLSRAGRGPCTSAPPPLCSLLCHERGHQSIETEIKLQNQNYCLSTKILRIFKKSKILCFRVKENLEINLIPSWEKLIFTITWFWSGKILRNKFVHQALHCHR